MQTPYHVEAEVNMFLVKRGVSKPAYTRDHRVQKQLSYTIGKNISEITLGKGGFSKVYRAVDLESGQVVVLKKSRVPLTVKRPVIQHESRILQMLQGHTSIPQLIGYGQLEHFEYMSMEVLGPNVREKVTGSLIVVSVVRIIEQTLSALKHVHKHGLVHRDIKPENLLCSNKDPSKIILIDFGIAKPTSSGPPRMYNPTKEKKYTVGTPNWASLNSHRGIDLGPGGDLESLAYTALFLLRGKLPWRNYQRWGREYPTEPFLRSQFRIYRSKAAVSGSQLVMNFPTDFAHLLDYSRGLGYHQMPDYDELEGRFSQLGKSLGGYTKGDPLDWTSIPTIAIESSVLDEDNFDKEDDTDYEEDDKDSDSEVHDNSYYGTDLDCWDDVHSSRDVSLTLPTDVGEVVKSQIPTIIEVRGR